LLRQGILTGENFTPVTYDYNGNTLTKVVGSNTTSYAWDFENRMTSVTLPGSGGTVTFKYDPFGRRIYKSSSSGTSIYAYDKADLIEETNGSGAVVARYAPGENIDQPLAMLRGGATSFYHADGLGSVTSLSNAAGALTQTYTFDSFGNQTASSGSLTNSFRYTGREFDPETNLYFYRARYYDSTGGRFLGEDPLGFPGSGSNFYAYAGNDPASLSDPFGLCPTKKPKCKKCQTKVLAAVNSKIGVPVTLVGATAFPQGMPGTDANDPGMRNGACNFDFFVPGYTPPPMLGNCGRYPPNFTGIGPSLHIVYPGGSCNPLDDPTTYNVDSSGFYFTAHIDSGYPSPLTPLGAITHGIVDVLLKIKHGC
jgi:RHS repeat-associated protein